ncbi:hypothetical protein BN903_516 [Halorubrum sp. AJ67]|nr:hypothetical protein BN903_516 [Halorubrum sp. AJ67]
MEVETTAGLAGVRCVISTESVHGYRLSDASEAFSCRSSYYFGK